MPSKSKKPTQAELRKFRSQWAKLRDKGLVKNDARSQKMTKHAKSQIRKYADVLSGKAVVVQVPRGKGKDYDGIFPRSGDKVAVSRPFSKGTVRFNQKEGRISLTRQYPGGKQTSFFYGKMTPEEYKALEAKGVSFSFRVARGSKDELLTYQTYSELQHAMEFGTFRIDDWQRHIQVGYFTPDKKFKGE